MTFCGVTMVGGIDIVGELEDPNDANFAELQHPYLLQFEIDKRTGLRTNTVNVSPMLKGSKILAGISIMVNMKNVLWLFEPSMMVSAEYQRQRTGIIRAAGVAIDQAVNQ
jgi:hypothetical protein